MTDYVSNIMAVLDRATIEDRLEGVSWYRDHAYGIALELTPDDVWRGAGVLSALSPLKKWPQNVAIARRSVETGVAQGSMPVHMAIAQRILDGEHPLDVMRGDKTRAFCAAIACAGKTDIATIDRHAHDVAMGRVFTDDTRRIGKRVYRDMAAAYAVAARQAGMTVNEAQATAWVTWRREKGVR